MLEDGVPKEGGYQSHKKNTQVGRNWRIQPYRFRYQREYHEGKRAQSYARQGNPDLLTSQNPGKTKSLDRKKHNCTNQGYRHEDEHCGAHDLEQGRREQDRNHIGHNQRNAQERECIGEAAGT